MHENKKGQNYIIVQTNIAGDDIIHRVKFLATGHIQAVLNASLQEGNFEDESLIVEDEVQKVETIIESKTIATSFDELKFENMRTGQKVIVKSKEELEAFIVKYKLLDEAVQMLIEGTQKTHKKWALK